MVGFIAILIIMNIVALIYIIHVLRYIVRGLLFLTYAKGILIKNEELNEVQKITDEDLPLFANFLLGTKGMGYFIIITIFINLITMLFGIWPEVTVTTITWALITGTVAVLNAFIIVSFNSFTSVKTAINAVCEAYNVLLQSYDHIEEYEENNNDSSN